MRSITDELALIQNPISDEDLIIHIITQLGDKYSPIIAALKVCESSIDFSELFDKLTDFERTLKDRGSSSPPTIVIANTTQKQHAQQIKSRLPFQFSQVRWLLWRTLFLSKLEWSSVISTRFILSFL